MRNCLSTWVMILIFSIVWNKVIRTAELHASTSWFCFWKCWLAQECLISLFTNIMLLWLILPACLGMWQGAYFTKASRMQGIGKNLSFALILAEVTLCYFWVWPLIPQIVSLMISWGPEHHVRCPIISPHNRKNLYYSIIERKFQCEISLEENSHINEAILDALDKPNCQLNSTEWLQWIPQRAEEESPLCILSGSVMSDSLHPHGCKAPLAMGFARQDYWSGLPCP